MKKMVFKTFLMASTLAATQLFAQASTSDVKKLADQFLSNLQGDFSIDTSRTTKAVGREMPTLKNGDWYLTDKPLPLVDSFAMRTNALSTIFVKMGDDFVRLSTTLSKTGALSIGTIAGEDAGGTVLDRSSPAYQALIKNMRYTGEMMLNGKRFMTDYDVFKDNQGNVVGAYMVGVPL